jgi:acetyl-CoA C-acetyltransferase
VVRSAEELAKVTERNRIVAEPYPRMTVARDQVNQAAAIILASAGLARALGVPEDRWVHIHAVSAATEVKLAQRPDLAAAPASIASVEAALARAGKAMDDMAYLDFYSCFAIPVFNQCDHFGLAYDDPRGLTLTGGLPFFGGAGNNYSAHAIAEAVRRVRADRGAFALVGANGGWMSKYATGIYSCQPADWRDNDRFVRLPKSTDKVPLAEAPVQGAVVETYTINHGPKGPEAIFIGRTEAGKRVVGNADLGDPATAAAFESGEPFDKRLTLTQDDRGRTVGRVA